nr:histidine kinase [uncultured Carboxylicivirga sp.]
MMISKKCQPKIISYKARLLFEVTMGAMFNLIIVKMFFPGDTSTCQSLAFTIGLFVLISEGIFAFNKLLGYKYSWHQHTLKRLLLLVIFTGFWFVVVSIIAHLTKPLLEHNREIPPTLFWASLVISILFVFIYVSLLIAYNYHQSLAMFIRENEALKNEKLQLDYRALQDQINPHFLFNNLSTLIAIIRQDQKAAIRFAENFSDVYRYVLKSKDAISVTLEEEMTFINAYLEMHKERLGEGLQLEYNILPEVLEMKIPMLSLQLLVENAIKHNVATLAHPLKIEIKTDQDFVTVKNNLNLKNSTYSTNTGLKNLEKRIAFLTDKKINIIKDSNEFIVELPLIKN